VRPDSERLFFGGELNGEKLSGKRGSGWFFVPFAELSREFSFLPSRFLPPLPANLAAAAMRKENSD
jgi:hypothetical protein